MTVDREHQGLLTIERGSADTDVGDVDTVARLHIRALREVALRVVIPQSNRSPLAVWTPP